MGASVDMNNLVSHESQWLSHAFDKWRWEQEEYNYSAHRNYCVHNRTDYSVLSRAIIRNNRLFRVTTSSNAFCPSTRVEFLLNSILGLLPIPNTNTQARLNCLFFLSMFSFLYSEANNLLRTRICQPSAGLMFICERLSSQFMGDV